MEEKTIQEELEDEDWYDYVDVEEKKDASMWPENLLSDIFGFEDGYEHNPAYNEPVSQYFKTEPKVKIAIDYVLSTLLVKEVKVIRSIYMEGKSIKEIAKQKRKADLDITKIKEMALRKLRNPSRSKYFLPIFREIDNKIIKK